MPPALSGEPCLAAAAASNSDASSVSIADSSPSKRLSPTATREAPSAVTAALAPTAYRYLSERELARRRGEVHKNQMCVNEFLGDPFGVAQGRNWCGQQGNVVTQRSCKHSPRATAEVLATQVDPSKAVPASGIAQNADCHTREQESCRCLQYCCVVLDFV